MRLDAPTLEAGSVAGVLSEIAETASETLELQDVFGRIATAVRRVIPIEGLGVIRILDGPGVGNERSFGVWAMWKDGQLDSGPTGPDDSDECGKPCTLDMWSPRLRPRPGPIQRVNDARVELDATFPGDAHILEQGVRSAMWEPFRTRDSFVGGVWASASNARAFTDEHQEILRPIAALLGAAVEHWRLWDTERRRQQRLDRVEELLGTLAKSLDVRDVFQRLSDEAKSILPHDMMVLTELDQQARTIRVLAYAGSCDSEIPKGPVPMTHMEFSDRRDFEIIHDIPSEFRPDTDRKRFILESGLRSWLRVPVISAGETRGSLSFFHREPSRYTREDAGVARRLADRIALSLSFGALAEEARVAAQVREHARRLEAMVERLARELEARGRTRVVGVSPSWKETLRAVGRVAPSDTTVFITGESGTGKEVISNLIHQGSSRAEKPFVAINCAALPEQLLESELFGHEKGAFTGASAVKIGRVEQADGGTLFLDEVAEMSPVVQAKLLRVLEQREFQRLGGTRTIKADVRVIAATNRDLREAISRQTFREDLYYRLNVFQIHIAALRDRPQDIVPLAEAFLEDLGKSMGRPSSGISRDAKEWLLSYHWPGNVRELRNAIERAILLCDGGLITHDHLPAPMTFPSEPVARVANGTNGASMNGDVVDLESMERSLVERALGQSKGNKTRAARLLGVTRAQLYSRLDKYGLR
ncbi:MAG TPA: sigma 54-interacting transcriptional regulator [Candidatus Sulfotelmatobacter sp.]|nr:sigma 54-interacting transcriptional regulator [Candidatus Sulfotelmatobacter sp.]